MKKQKKSQKNVRAIIVFFGALIVSANLIGFMFNGKGLFSSFYHYISVVSLGFSLGLFLGGGNALIGRGFGRSLNWRKNPQRANSITLTVMVVYGIIVSILIPFIYNKYIWKVPDNRLMQHIIPSAFFTLMLDFFFTAIYYSKYLAIYWGKSIKQEEQLEKENLKAKYEALKNQVNPHFLFNSLNTLTGLVEKDQKLAVQYIKKLSDIFRRVMETKDQELIPIKEELDCVADYIFLQKLRHGEGLQYNVSSGLNGYVAPLAIQMLVENAIKHNIVAYDQPLKIEIMQKGNYLVIKNNLQKKKVIEAGNAVGLENLIARYKYISDNEVEIRETDTEFVVNLPLMNSLEG
ncbi:MAG: histidine kinase [Bacteroidales bacterium]|nr:histidine kinase [Bacteroidales bacterium]